MKVPPDSGEFFVSGVLPRSTFVELTVPAPARGWPLAVRPLKVIVLNWATGWMPSPRSSTIASAEDFWSEPFSWYVFDQPRVVSFPVRVHEVPLTYGHAALIRPARLPSC